MNLEKLHEMYLNISSERSVLKTDIEVAERKLIRKDEKITILIGITYKSMLWCII